VNYLPGTDFKLRSPDLCLLSSWDYRHEPLVPGFICIFKLCLADYHCEQEMMTARGEMHDICRFEP
jgi:hypothetical protein